MQLVCWLHQHLNLATSECHTTEKKTKTKYQKIEHERENGTNEIAYITKQNHGRPNEMYTFKAYDADVGRSDRVYLNIQFGFGACALHLQVF